MAPEALGLTIKLRLLEDAEGTALELAFAAPTAGVTAKRTLKMSFNGQTINQVIGP